MAEALELRREHTGETLFGSLWKFAKSSIGAKVIMALTGLGLWVFVVGHLAGNLLAFAGREAFNDYAHALKSNAILLWGARSALIVGFPLHVFAAIRAASLDRAARPTPYAYANKTPTRAASKTMLISGLLILTYFLFHLAHFTWHVVGPQPTATLPNGAYDAYTMLVLGFQQPVLVVLYVAAMVLLAAHLSHGIYSLFQHLGLWGKRWTPFLKQAALVVGYGLSLAFASIPLAVLLGVIKP